MKEAIEGHLECMRQFGYAIPEPTTVAEEVDVAA
jgi:predicted RNase H-like HicB family nuclease